MKILAIDDDPVAQLVLESALKSLGHEVVLAADGEAAWAVLTDRAVRMVVCDWWLPRLNGLELCRRLRARGAEYVYFVLLTNQSASTENLDLAFAAGVDDFFTKPVQLRELKLRLHVAARILDFTSELHRLEALLPICGYCKKVRDDKEYWQEIETYLTQRTGARFSHGICPDCYDRIMVPQLKKLGIVPPPQLNPPIDPR